MKPFRDLSLCIIVSLVYGVINGNADIVNERLDLLENEVDNYSKRLDVIVNQIAVDNTDLKINQGRQILSLKTELKTKIRERVTEALAEILQGESIEDLIKSEVVSEVRHLKRANHQMRRRMHHMETSFRKIQEDNQINMETIQKGEGVNSDLITCSRYLAKSEMLTVELSERDLQIRELTKLLKEKNDSCVPSPKTVIKEVDSMLECSNCLRSELLNSKLSGYDRQIREMKQKLREHSDSCKLSNRTISKEISSSTLDPPTTITTTSSTTTSAPAQERRKLLVAPLWRSDHLQFRQLDIITNSFDIYPYLSLQKYEYILYVSKINSLLIGLYNPYKIIISELNIYYYKTIRNNVRTHGMAADEGRGIVFLTAHHPTKTISMMTLRGENFTSLVSLSSYGSNPRAISVNPKLKTIYACNYGKLFTLFYDGTGLRTLDTGSDMNAVTLDITKGILYYSKEKRVRKMTLSSEMTSEVKQFGFHIWNLIYYQNKVYFSSRSKTPGVVGVVDVGHSVVSKTLQTVNMSGVTTYAICLIP